MKRLFIVGLILFGILHLSAQDFDFYFANKTLRINYLHIGKNDSEQIKISQLYQGGKWTGTRTSLVEENRKGDMMFEVFDAASGKLIYSRSYCCLFAEYSSTVRAEKEVKSFEEAVLLPYPKQKINYKFTSFNRKKTATTVYEGHFDPNLDLVYPYSKSYKVINLHNGGKPEQCLDILFIPDGYTRSQKKLMQSDMEKFAEYITQCSPYKENLNKLNIRGIEGFSEEAGITDPNALVHKHTLLNSSFNTIDLDRYLMCLNVWKMHDIAEDAPYDVIVIIANTPKYGGGGIYNFYATVNSEGKESAYVIVHELGHLVAGLADEYYNSEVSVRDCYPEGIEPIEPNLTTLVDFSSKWKNMLDDKTPVPTPDTKQYNKILGVYEGGGYVAEGVYRPWRNCTMKDIIYNNFCPVCSKALIETLNYYSK